MYEEKTTLDVLRAQITVLLDERLEKHFAGSRSVELSSLADFHLDRVAVLITQKILGNTLEEVNVTYPTTWWDAFKDRFLPFSKINYTTVRLIARELYPKLTLPDRDPIINLTRKIK